MVSTREIQKQPNNNQTWKRLATTPMLSNILCLKKKEEEEI